MATVTVKTAAGTVPKRRRVVIKSGTRQLVFPITDEVTDLGDRGGKWTSIDRPGLDPLLRYAGGKPDTVTLAVRLIPLGAVSPHKALDHLAVISRSASPVSMSYGSSEVGTYRITSIRPKVDRRTTTNSPSEIEVSVEFTRIGDERITVPSRVKPAKPKAKQSTGSTTTKKRTVQYTVKRGDTLVKIASKVCHNSGHWQRIARDNKIRDPRKLRVGQRLTITCL